MSRSRIIIIVIIIGVFAAAALAYAFLRPTEEASAPIEAIPISQGDQGPAAVDGESAADESGEKAADTGGSAAETEGSASVESGAGDGETSQPGASESEQQESGAEKADTTDPESESADAPSSEPESSEPILFQISQAESEARFSIDEVLRGSPKTVIGITDQVAGEILFNPADPTTAQVGMILVNARTLATDDDRRNRAIGNQILDTAAYEFISFEPTAISGLPGEVSSGDTVNFQIMGNLTIRDVTREVTFEATVTFVSEERLVGSASTVIIKEDFGLTIPDVPFVANVSEEVGLEIDFVALPVP